MVSDTVKDTATIVGEICAYESELWSLIREARALYADGKHEDGFSKVMQFLRLLDMGPDKWAEEKK